MKLTFLFAFLSYPFFLYSEEIPNPETPLPLLQAQFEISLKKKKTQEKTFKEDITWAQKTLHAAILQDNPPQFRIPKQTPILLALIKTKTIVLDHQKNLKEQKTSPEKTINDINTLKNIREKFQKPPLNTLPSLVKIPEKALEQLKTPQSNRKKTNPQNTLTTHLQIGLEKLENYKKRKRQASKLLEAAMKNDWGNQKPFETHRIKTSALQAILELENLTETQTPTETQTQIEEKLKKFELLKRKFSSYQLRTLTQLTQDLLEKFKSQIHPNTLQETQKKLKNPTKAKTAYKQAYKSAQPIE